MAGETKNSPAEVSYGLSTTAPATRPDTEAVPRVTSVDSGKMKTAGDERRQRGMSGDSGVRSWSSFSSRAKLVTRQSTSRAGRCALGFGTSPCQLLAFVRMLSAKFGGFIAMAVLQYGVNQGVGMIYAGMARRYYFADVLHLDGATIGRFTSAAQIPWCMKPVLGIVSDAYPMFGFHRTSYIVASCFLGVVSYLTLGLVPLTAVATVPFFILINFSVSVPDVMIDATTAQLSKSSPESASDLQSLCWGALAIGGLGAAATSGMLVEALGPHHLFLLVSVCPLASVVPGLLRWLPEQRVPRGERRFNPEFLRQHRPITLLALFMTAASVSLSVMQVVTEDARIRGAATLACGALLACFVWRQLRGVTPLLAKTAIFIFLRECMQPSLGDPMFMWMSHYEDGPKFSAKVLGWVDCFGYLGLLLGVTLYNKYLTSVSYRKIFTIAQVALVFSNLSDLILVKRWNRDYLGIPDIVFIMGDDAVTTCMSRFFVMPLFVLASKVCPDNVEATLFALLMALSNFGSSIGTFFGVSLCEAFGIVGDNFDRLPEAVVAKSLFRLLPIPLIFLLVPNLSPNDPIDAEEGGYAVTRTKSRAVTLDYSTDPAAPPLPPHDISELGFERGITVEL